MNRDTSHSTAAGLSTRTLPTITASFSSYKPPRNLVPMIRRMLMSLQEQYLLGLGEVVLTDAASLPRRRRRSVTRSRGRKVSVREVRGLYHPAFQNRAAWIEIFIDNTFRRSSRGIWRLLPFVREWDLREVLFHEIGHHIHFTIRPEYREKEDVADVWKVRLQGEYYRHCFPLLRRFVRPFWPLFGGWIDRMFENTAKSMLEKGAISRAEFKESVGATNREEGRDRR